jgi:hypothetical protein
LHVGHAEKLEISQGSSWLDFSLSVALVAPAQVPGAATLTNMGVVKFVQARRRVTQQGTHAEFPNVLHSRQRATNRSTA